MAVDDSVLREALERMIGGADGRLVALARRPYAYRTSFPLEELDVRFADGRRLSLISKDLDRTALDEPAREAKPEFLHDPLREIVVYRDVLAPMGLGTARYYGSLADPERRRFRLFIEKVAGVELWQIGEIELWEEAACWLARFHEEASRIASPHLLSYDAGFFAGWLERALVFARGDVLSRVAARYDDVVTTLLALPRRLVHGEFYAANILVARGGDTPRIAPIDWEMAGVGPALIDLAALTSGRWSDDDRGRIEAAYASACSRPLAEDELAVGLACCRLHLALQWLGWSPTWAPPNEHRHDWLGEARAAAERLGL
jgi:Phosphotransferase enzyme family